LGVLFFHDKKEDDFITVSGINRDGKNDSFTIKVPPKTPKAHQFALIKAVEKTIYHPAGFHSVKAFAQSGMQLFFSKKRAGNRFYPSIGIGYSRETIKEKRLWTRTLSFVMDDLLTTLEHEFAHFKHEKDGVFDLHPALPSQKNLLTQIYEADARVHEVAFAHIEKKNGYSEKWEILKDNYPEITSVFEAGAENGRILSEIMAHSFAATLHLSPYVGFYQENESVRPWGKIFEKIIYGSPFLTKAFYRVSRLKIFPITADLPFIDFYKNESDVSLSEILKRTCTIAPELRDKNGIANYAAHFADPAQLFQSAANSFSQKYKNRMRLFFSTKYCKKNKDIFEAQRRNIFAASTWEEKGSSRLRVTFKNPITADIQTFHISKDGFVPERKMTGQVTERGSSHLFIAAHIVRQRVNRERAHPFILIR
jgi:hypothetical protein